MTTSPTSIDLSRVPFPNAILELDFQTLKAEFIGRYLEAWADRRIADPNLPQYDVETIETDPVVIAGARAWSWLRLYERGRFNDGVKAVLAPLSTGSDLENVVASQSLARLTVTPATENAPAVMETDEGLLRRYLLSFDRASVGSIGRYLLEAWTVWPGMGHAVVNGRAVHGRLGDSDVVITGPGGRDPTPVELALVTAAVRAPNVKPEAMGVAVISATRREYSVDQVIEVPPIGPDAEVVRNEAIARVRAAGDARTLIGGEVPDGLMAGAAYGQNVIRVRDNAPVVIAADPYTVPVLTGIDVAAEVRA
ncbi:baseplate J/gp47 family protein [Amorphus sp. MBR-141]